MRKTFLLSFFISRVRFLIFLSVLFSQIKSFLLDTQIEELEKQIIISYLVFRFTFILDVHSCDVIRDKDVDQF